MQHLGDITKIDGAVAPVVDCIIGGSPCQDLSMAGKRAGLAGERSGLYMEQLRVIKEMRKQDELCGRTGEFIRPRYMVWENVPGAFSCNKGEDFGAVLTEAVRVIEPEAPDVPVPEKGCPTAGVLLGDEWSIAWRVLDAQYWGVPQRRRRIALVCDFGGHSAEEILFVSKSVSGHPEPSGAEGQGIAGDSERGSAYTIQGSMIGRADKNGPQGDGINEDVSFTLNTTDRHAVCYNGSSITSPINKANPHPGDPCHTLTDDSRNYVVLENHPQDSRVKICKDGIFQTLSQQMGTGGGNVPMIMQAFGDYKEGDIASSCKQRDYKDSTDLVVSVDCRGMRETETNATPQAKESGGYNLNSGYTIREGMTVRRLTPMECERLQGYPDGWTDIGEWVDSKGKKHKEADSPRYKALGNSIALPPWRWVIKRLCSQYERTATMASLFDGIGGFPLIWEGINGKGTCLWASEIEEFPMAVTKLRFGGNR